MRKKPISERESGSARTRAARAAAAPLERFGLRSENSTRPRVWRLLPHERVFIRERHRTSGLGTARAGLLSIWNLNATARAAKATARAGLQSGALLHIFFIWAAGCPRLPPRQLWGFKSSILRWDRSSEPSSMVLPSISP